MPPDSGSEEEVCLEGDLRAEEREGSFWESQYRISLDSSRDSTLGCTLPDLPCFYESMARIKIKKEVRKKEKP